MKKDFIVSLNIARVGALQSSNGLIFVNRKFIKCIKPLNLYSFEILTHTKEKKWLVFEPLDILKTWDWYLLSFPKGIDEFPESNLCRAINAFTYLFDANSGEIEKLFWCLVGIEALYTNKNDAIKEQVTRKSQIFLGEIFEFKKRLSHMYDYRSTFVHGSKDFPGFFHIHDALYSHEKYIKENGETLNVAKSLLIATLQKIVKCNLAELRFEYVFKNDTKP